MEKEKKNLSKHFLKEHTAISYKHKKLHSAFTVTQDTTGSPHGTMPEYHRHEAEARSSSLPTGLQQPLPTVLTDTVKKGQVLYYDYYV